MAAFGTHAASCVKGVGRRLEPVVQLLPDVVKQNPRFAAVAVVVGLSGLWARGNYLEFKATGPGGLPYNVRGWLMALVLKLFARETQSTREYDRDANKDSWIEGKDKIPSRVGPRPRHGFHVVPARQTDQIPVKEMMVVSTAPTFPSLEEVPSL